MKHAAVAGIPKKMVLILISVFALVFFFSACVRTPDLEVSVEMEATESEPQAADDEGLTFSLTTLTGETADDSIISENKLTMVNFWATWCGPCVSEIPDLQKISEDYADQDFALIGVLFGDDDIDGAKDFIAEQEVTYPNILPEGPFADLSSDIYAIPTTMFFDSDGNQVGGTVVGGKSYDDWAELIENLLGQVS